MMALRIPHPVPPGGHVQISIPVEFDAIGDSIPFSSGLLAKDFATGQSAVTVKIINANIPLLAIVDIELFAVGRKREAIRLSEFFREQSHVSLLIEPVHALKGNFLGFALRQVERGIGK